MTLPDKILLLTGVGDNFFLSVPFLVKGKLVYPPAADHKGIVAAFEKVVSEEGKQPREVTRVAGREVKGGGGIISEMRAQKGDAIGKEQQRA